VIPVHLAAPAALHLKVWVVRPNGGITHVQLLDNGSRAARVQLSLPLMGAATVQRLAAPKVTSSAGVTLTIST
jgi:hypothetical protein